MIETTGELKETIISIASILNNHQNGKLYFGIKDNGDIIGQEVSGKTLREEGERFRIIEDCGGTMGLEDIKEAFKIKKGEDYEMYSNWLEKDELDMNNCY